MKTILAYDFVMTEHPAWLPAPDGGRRRVFATPDDSRWLVTISGDRADVAALVGNGRGPEPDVFGAPAGSGLPSPELEAALDGLGAVARFRNADLWDAIGTGILRQVIRAAQSKRLYRAFCAAYGEQVELPGGGTYALFPSPEIVSRLSAEAFTGCGLAFKRRPLQAAAEAYTQHGHRWRELPPSDLVEALQDVPRIGPWTARAAVADWSNDWALYPYTDLAVRTWAGRAAPSFDWPSDEKSFGRLWRAFAGEHLSSLTLLTLAWGSCHGDIG